MYKQFHLDEPWDSDHNIKLLDKMPLLYRNPNGADDSETNFLAVTGKGTAFDGKNGKRFKDFKGGTSNAILFVESNKFVPWSKPVDYEVDWEDPTNGLGGIRPGGFQAGFADGSVQFMSSFTDEKMLKAMFRINESVQR